MRIISKATLRAFWANVAPDAEPALRLWALVVEEAEWRNPAAVKDAFGKRVDFVKVASGRTAAVFDIRGNHYRLIAAIHYLVRFPAKGRVYVLRVLTHAEYDLDRWKKEL